MSAYQAAGDIWVQLFSCCVNQPAQQQKRQRRRIDRSMIGEPTNFRHTGHIGSEDVENSRLWAIQNQMQSKGGYENPHSTVKCLKEASSILSFFQFIGSFIRQSTVDPLVLAEFIILRIPSKKPSTGGMFWRSSDVGSPTSVYSPPITMPSFFLYPVTASSNGFSLSTAVDQSTLDLAPTFL